MASNRPAERLKDIVENCERIQKWTADVTFREFSADDLLTAAIERCVERITDSMGAIRPVYEAKYPELQWQHAHDMGKLLRHNYDEVHRETIWHIAQVHLPPVEEMARKESNALDRMVLIEAWKTEPMMVDAWVRDAASQWLSDLSNNGLTAVAARTRAVAAALEARPIKNQNAMLDALHLAIMLQNAELQARGLETATDRERVNETSMRRTPLPTTCRRSSPKAPYG